MTEWGKALRAAIGLGPAMTGKIACKDCKQTVDRVWQSEDGSVRCADCVSKLKNHLSQK